MTATVRRQTLEEWFTDLQVTTIARHHAHVPFDMEVDVTPLARLYAAAGRRPPFTAIAVKGAGVLAMRHPQVNRIVLRAPFGTRVVQFDEAHVNIPIAIQRDGRRHLTATVVRNADQLDIETIGERLQAARERPFSELPIARRLATQKNTPLQRALLGARHFAAYAVPALYAKHGGGISVSSVVRPAHPGVLLRTPSFGPTAFTICPGTVRESGGRTILHVGIGYDHAALAGADAVACAEAFGALLAEGDPQLFGPRDAVAHTTGRASRELPPITA
jgi:hypothetical protein